MCATIVMLAARADILKSRLFNGEEGKCLDDEYKVIYVGGSNELPPHYDQSGIIDRLIAVLTVSLATDLLLYTSKIHTYRIVHRISSAGVLEQPFISSSKCFVV